jgi:glycosyltransferase involved in cell wall biosynthesis
MDAPKVAIVHDWMLLGGAEKVVEQLLEMYPEAPLYTSCMSDEWYRKLSHRTIIMGYLDWPFFRKVRKFVPFLRQRWFSTLDFSPYDIVISSSGAEAKGIKVPEGVLHINYCHAPTHYYWSRYEQYLAHPGFGKLDPLARWGLKLLLAPMRKWDYAAAQRPHIIAANSNHTAEQVKKYYGRDAVVVHPPVDTARFAKKSETPRRGYVAAGRQTPYKRIDLAVEACSRLGLPLTVAGNGPDHEKLKALAGPTVTFATNVSDARMVRYFQEAKGFLFPGVDDFGITPVEAMAAGTPVLAFKAGGALDYVVQGKTGLFFDAQTAASLEACLKIAENKKWNESVIAKKAAEFTPEKFRKDMQKVIDAAYESKLAEAAK